MTEKPIVAITMGDPASIGPEITLKALNHTELHKKCRPIVVGDAAILKQALKIQGIPQLEIRQVNSVSEAEYSNRVINVLDIQVIKDTPLFTIGEVSKQAGEASFQYVKKVIELAMANEVDATVTNAINKESVNLAGHHYAGHTEIYAHFTRCDKYTMLLAHKSLRIVHVSTHLSLREACDRVKKERVLEVIQIANKACKDMGILFPRIGVAGLNPHSGENGLFGMEEINEIIPAIEAAKSDGIIVDGPVPPDTIFSKAVGGWFDIVVAMYHDQGHIPLKVIGFVYDIDSKKWLTIEGVNITLGLPIIRTSVDHGTAFDQAGKGTASELSLVNAIEYAINFAKCKINLYKTEEEIL